MNSVKQLSQFDVDIFTGLAGSDLEQRRAQVKLFETFYYIIAFGQTRYLLSEDAAADAYSDTILAVILSISTGKFGKHCSLKTYVYQIFQNKCVDLIRQKTARKNRIHGRHCLIEEAVFLPDNTRSTLDKLISRSQLATVVKMMGYLHQSHRRVLLLSAEGYSDKEIAGMSDYNSADVVKTCRLRSLRKVRSMLPVSD